MCIDFGYQFGNEQLETWIYTTTRKFGFAI